MHIARVIFLFLFAGFLPISYAELTNEIRLALITSERPFTIDEEAAIAGSIANQMSAYQNQLNSVSAQSFQGRDDISASSAIALMKEIEVVKSTIAEIVPILKQLETGENDKKSTQAYAWIRLARSIAVLAPYFDDIQEWRIVENENPRLWQLYLPGIFDMIITRRVVELGVTAGELGATTRE